MSDKARITSAFNLTKNIVRNNFHGDFLPDYPVNISYFDIWHNSWECHKGYTSSVTLFKTQLNLLLDWFST